MWLGVAAGLALLTLSLSRLANAQNVTVNDQRLLYDGPGWGTFGGSQACADISQTVHTTKHTGDTVSFSFTGNAVFVHGPSTSGPIPMTVVLDGTIQSVPPLTQDDTGCGILYSNPNIVNGRQQHTLVIVFNDPSGSLSLSISGISSFATAVTPPLPAPPLSNGQSPTGTLSAIDPNATGSPPVGNVVSSTASGAAATSPPVKSALGTTPGMTIGVIGAIIGAIAGMIVLLVVFILIRRRITRQTARRLNGFYFRRDREMEEGKGKGKLPKLEAWRRPEGMERGPIPSYAFGWDVQGRAVRQGPGQAGGVFVPAVPPPAASGMAFRSVFPPPPSQRNRSPASSRRTPATKSMISSPLKHPPAALVLHSHGSGSPLSPSLQTGSSAGLSRQPTLPSFSWEPEPGEEEGTQRGHVEHPMERTASGESGSSARTGLPRPGYF